MAAAHEHEVADETPPAQTTSAPRAPRIQRAVIQRAMIVAPARDSTTPVAVHETIAVQPPRAVAQRATVQPSAVAARATVQPTATDSASVAARYIAVGKALRGQPDELWQRYRRIRINDALQTPASRQQVLDTLAQIEAALAAR